MRVTFHGAAGEVTGSCHLVEVNGYRILLECGLIQGRDEDEARNHDPFPFDVSALDAVVLSHAHIDHAGRLPLLVKRGFKGPIWTHAATADLLRIMLEDAASLAAADADWAARHPREGERPKPPLYTHRDVADTLRQVRPMAYGTVREIVEGVRVRLTDAGHILGSAIVELWGKVDSQMQARKLVFSGDLGMRAAPILRDPAMVEDADLVLMESTYGDRPHRGRGETVTELGEILRDAWESGGNVLIPAFAVGRTQEILYWCAKHWDDWKLSRWRIFLDSPMAIKVLEVYNRHTSLFDADASKVWVSHPHPFRLPNLRLTSDSAQSQEINAVKGGAIIIAGSGMCNGGRIRHHLRQNLGRANAHVVFVGFQARGTLGRRLVDGSERVRILGEDIRVNARVHTVGGLSAHADQPMLLDWYRGFRGTPPVVLVHGEDRAREPLAEKLRTECGADVRLAEPGLCVEV